jgi:carbon storage regulator
MLVLTRRNGERIRIGDAVILTVIRIRGCHVRLGIEAPRNMHIKRDELPLHPPSSVDVGCMDVGLG